MRVHLLLLKRLRNKTRKEARPSITRNIIITIIIERENAFGWSRQKSSRHKTIKQKKKRQDDLKKVEIISIFLPVCMGSSQNRNVYLSLGGFKLFLLL